MRRVGLMCFEKRDRPFRSAGSLRGKPPASKGQTAFSTACILCLGSFLLLAALVLAADSPPSAAASDRAALEAALAEKLSGAVFSGHYSVLHGDEEKPAEMEKYTITKAAKLKDDVWLLATRIQYNKIDVEIPLSLHVHWAGDTPVITLTNLTIPGLGTFTSRVLIYGDRYAGTWQHDQTGGHLWGRIEKIRPEKTEKEQPGQPAAGK